MKELPESHEPYTDKYFLRAKKILVEEGINPWVRGQVFIRNGPGKAYGIDEAIAIIDKYSKLNEHGGKIYALEEGADYSASETLMLIEGPIQDIIDLETMYLGVISAETTKKNEGYNIDLEDVTRKMAAVVEAAKGRPVSYFGARHWRYDEDAAIAGAAFKGGAKSTSTDMGAAVIGEKGMGTIPHVLENVMAWKYGKDDAVLEALLAFDNVIEKDVPRIPLIDYNNREMDDTLRAAETLGDRLYGIRIDTCGENLAQGAQKNKHEFEALTGMKIEIPTEDEKYWFGNGVTVSGVYALRKALNDNGYEDVKTILSSGFGDARKVEAFTRAEEIIGIQLYHMLGVGGVFHSRHSKMDIVAVGETADSMVPISKVGRQYNPNPRLKLRYGGG